MTQDDTSALRDLALCVLKALDLQRRYFGSRTAADLATCKEAERLLRKRCREILDYGPPGLFDQGHGQGG